MQQKPTLATLRNRITSLHSSELEPFNQPVFEQLLECPYLKAESSFYEKISAAHHKRKRNLTPNDAAKIDKYFDPIKQLIVNCQTTYLIHIERLPKGPNIESNKRPELPTPLQLDKNMIPILGRITAKSVSRTATADPVTIQNFRFEDLGPIALYDIRSSTLNLIYLPDQTTIMNLKQKPQNGDLVIYLYNEKTYTKRLATNEDDSSIISLESISTTIPTPNTFSIPKAKARLFKIIRVLFDDRKIDKRGDAVLLKNSAALKKISDMLQVVNDSTVPVALPDQWVFVTPSNTDVASISMLEGNIVTVMDDQDEAYIKRLEQEVPGLTGAKLLEKIEMMGNSICIRFLDDTSIRKQRLPKIQSL